MNLSCWRGLHHALTIGLPGDLIRLLLPLSAKRAAQQRADPRRNVWRRGRLSEDREDEILVVPMIETRRVDRPRPSRMVGVGKANVAALVVGEIEVVIAEPVTNPIGYPDHRRTLDISPYGRVKIGRNLAAISFLSSGSSLIAKRSYSAATARVNSLTASTSV